jgi:GTPase
MKFLILSALALATVPAAAFAPNQAKSPFGISASSARFSTPVADTGVSSEVVSTEKLRNIAVIAHVDHGKTTLVRTITMWKVSPFSHTSRAETHRSELPTW